MGRETLIALLSIGIAGLIAGPVLGQVGEPTGFTVTVKQGSTTIAQQALTVGPAGDINDTKVNDGDPEGFAQIGTLSGPQGPAPIIIKVVTGDDPMFRLLSVFINAPISLADIHSPGPYSLFNPALADPIEVSLTNMTFAGTTSATPLLVSNSSFLTAFMRSMAGMFYELPQANPFNTFGWGVNDIQVPGVRFLDPTISPYSFTAVTGAPAEGTWSNIPNPGLTTTVHDGVSGGLPSDGSVFELGLSMALVGVPEPSTVLMLLGGLVILARRRR
jgi:hypothetical protein